MAYNYNINKRSKVMMYKKYHKKIAYRLTFFHALDVFHATNNHILSFNNFDANLIVKNVNLTRFARNNTKLSKDKKCLMCTFVCEIC